VGFIKRSAARGIKKAGEITQGIIKRLERPKREEKVKKYTKNKTLIRARVVKKV
jgi:hypothetical protein